MAGRTAKAPGRNPIPSLRLPAIAGVEVSIDPSALVILGLLGYTSQRGLQGVVIFALVAVFAILVHELGHAAAFGAFGHRTEVQVYGMGGLTSSKGGPPLSPLRDLIVDVAGPFAGFALGGGVLLFWPGAGDGIAGQVRGDLLFATFVWGVLNLLPVLPLDGGQALLAILRGAKVASAEKTARIVSVAVAGGGAVLLLRSVPGGLFTALFAGFFAMQNLTELRRMKEQPLVAGLRAGYGSVVVGDADAAREAAQRTIDARPSHGLVVAATDLLVWAELAAGRLPEARAALALRPAPMLREDRTEIEQDRLPEACVALLGWLAAAHEDRPAHGLDGSLALTAAALDRGEWAPPNVLLAVLARVPAGVDRVLARCAPEGRARFAELAQAGGRPDLAQLATAPAPPTAP